MGQFGRAAVKATNLYRDGSASSPQKAWEKAVREEVKSASTQDEHCPRCAYLGLCEEGHVSGIRKGDYRSRSVKNKGYALKALSLLRQDPSRFPNQTTLWQAVMEGEEKAQHSQMDVVLSLWREGLIRA